MKWQVHTALTILGKTSGIVAIEKDPSVYGGMRPVEHKEPDNEIIQLAAEFPRSPMREHHFRNAFDEMRESCLERARKFGLIIP